MWKMTERNDLGGYFLDIGDCFHVHARCKHQRIVPKTSSHPSLKASKSLGLRGESLRQGREVRNRILTQVQHGCTPEEGTRGVSNELLKSDSRPLIRPYQANSLRRRPEHPRGLLRVFPRDGWNSAGSTLSMTWQVL